MLPASASDGAVRKTYGPASVIAGLAVAALGYRRAGLWFEDLTRSHEVALGLGFLSLFLLTLVVGILVSVLARKLIQKAGLQWFDRLLGGVFGLIRGVAVDCILLMALVAFSIKVEAVQQSRLAPFVATGARVVAQAMPGELKAQFQAGFEKFRQALAPQDKKTIQN